MYRAYRGTGILCCASALALFGGCFEKTSGSDYGTESGTTAGDDGGTSGEDGGTADDGGTDGSGTDDGGTGTTGGATSETSSTDGSTGGETGSTTPGDVVECVADPPLFPEFDKHCANVGECVLVFHTIDCCGTDVVWGINESEVDRFNEAEEICDAQYPGCGCAAGPTEAEDGNVGFGPEDFEVECTDGTCKSYVP